MSGLDDQDRAILDLEREWWQRPGSKEAAIRDAFGWTATRYFQRLGQVLDDPAALAYSPVVVKRLRRLRDQRQAVRSARRSA